MEKLTITKSSWHYRFLDEYDSFTHNLTKPKWCREELSINNSCDYITKMVKAVIGTLLWMAFTFFIAYTLVYDSILFYICASSVSQFDLQIVLALFNSMVESPIIEFTLIIYLSVVILIVGSAITLAAVLASYKVKNMKTLVVFYKSSEEKKEPSALSKMMKAKYDKICIPIQIVDSDK